MSKLLFIGSTVADVVIRLSHLPLSGEDETIEGQQVNLGGCAFNAFQTARQSGGPLCTLFSPVGTGVWGTWVKDALRQRGITTACPPVDEPNGCCYCLVEPDGQRTFLAHHGAEYRFQQAWFDGVSLGDYDGVYVCGLEIEEATGDHLLAALEQDRPRRLYFAPGPRLCRIRPEKMARLMALHPVFHLNEEEALAFTRADDAAHAAQLIHSLTANDVIITLGSQGAFLLCGEGMGMVPGETVTRVVDTIGAGDSHVGALMAAQAQGFSLPQAVAYANRVSAAVVQCSGAELPEDVWSELRLERF